jgi:HK97 family phage major capsid protein
LGAFVDGTNAAIEQLKAAEAEKQKAIDALAGENKELKAETTRLKNDLSGVIQINKINWEKSDSAEGADYRLGKYFAAFKLKDFKTMYNLGGRAVRSTENKVIDIWPKVSDRMVEKADLGTPLTGDASGTDAQYLVPQTIYDASILRTLMVNSEIIPKLDKRNMSGRLHRIPKEVTAVSFTVVTDEVTGKTETNPTWTYVDLTAETYAFWVGVTDELLEDTFTDIGAQIRIQAVEALQNTIEGQILDGSGSPATGLLRHASVNYVNMGSTSIADVSWGDLNNCIAALTTQKKKVGACWMMHPTVWDVLITDQDAMGRYFWDPANAGPRTARGYPVLLSDNMPDTSDSAASKAFLAFGNPYYMLWGIRMGMEMKYFDQTMYAVTNDENFWRVRTRQAFNIGIAANFAVLRTAAS